MRKTPEKALMFVTVAAALPETIKCGMQYNTPMGWVTASSSSPIPAVIAASERVRSPPGLTILSVDVFSFVARVLQVG